MTTELNRNGSADDRTTDAWQASLAGPDALALGLLAVSADGNTALLPAPLGDLLSDPFVPFARPEAARKAAKDDDDAEDADEDEDEDDDEEDEDEEEDDDFDDDVDEDDDDDEDDEDEDDDDLDDEDEDEEDDDFDDDDDDDDDEDEDFAGEEE